MSGRLILCGTPIGNLEDMGPRALRTLGEADLLACEDIARTRKLLSHFSIAAPRMIVLNEGNERGRTPEIVDAVKRGLVVVLVSDAGMPGLSDPGYRVVERCVREGLEVGVVPGPSAAVSALAISGLPPARFVFEGFLPRRRGERRRRAAELAAEERTIVLYESPHRIEASLEDLAAAFGERPAVLVREMTKIYEEARRGTLPELLASVRADPPRGEIVLVVGGAVRSHRIEPDAAELARMARALMELGSDRREALTEVARTTGVARRKVFDALLADPERGGPG